MSEDSDDSDDTDEKEQDLNWQVARQGQHWQIVGPNGAGKSTLLSLVTGDHPLPVALGAAAAVDTAVAAFT